MHYNPRVTVLVFFKLLITNVEAETFFNDLRDLCFECDCDIQRMLTESNTEAFLNNFEIVCDKTFGGKSRDTGFSAERKNVSQQIDFLVAKKVKFNNIDLRVKNLNLSSIDKLMKVLNPAIQIRKISFASNLIQRAPKVIFPKSAALEELILPDLRINGIESAGFSGLHKLKRIYLNDNSIESFNFDVFEDSKSLEEVNLSGNRIENMYCQSSTFSHLRNLDLSTNYINSENFEMIRICFSKFPRLRYLNLSNNDIESVGEGTFKSLRELRILDLSFNHLRYFSFHNWKELKNLEQLFLQHNQLGSENSIFPGGLDDLNLTMNSVGNTETVGSDSIDSLNISSNRDTEVKDLSAFLPKLQVLDVSWNTIQSVNVRDPFKSLRRLSLDGNRLNFLELNLSNFVSLEFLSLRKIGALEVFYSSNMAGIFTNKSSTECSTFILSLNPNLRRIFGNLSWTNICKFDLSSNKLTYINKNMFNWDKVKWINLEGNPLNCQCQMKWMVDALVPLLIKEDPALLKSLRCAEPTVYKQKRLVHWYNTYSTRCDPSERPYVNDPHVRDNSEIILKYGIFLAIGLVFAIIAVMLALGYVYFKIKETKRSRERWERNVRYSPSRGGVTQPI